MKLQTKRHVYICVYYTIIKYMEKQKPEWLVVAINQTRRSLERKSSIISLKLSFSLLIWLRPVCVAHTTTTSVIVLLLAWFYRFFLGVWLRFRLGSWVVAVEEVFQWVPRSYLIDLFYWDEEDVGSGGSTE